MLLTKNKSITASYATRFFKADRTETPLTRETVDARGDGAFVCQVSGDAAFVLGGGTSDEGGVEDEAVLGGVSTSLQGSEEIQPLTHTEITNNQQLQQSTRR